MKLSAVPPFGAKRSGRRFRSAHLLVWELEWRVAFRRRRLFYLNLAIPLLLVAPIALSGAPAVHAAAVYTVLFTLFATFGSAIPLIRDGEDGLLGRILLSGISPRAFLLQRLCAQAALDTVQLTLPFLVIMATSAAAGGAGFFLGVAFLVHGIVILFLALLLANVLGAWIAALARSVAEGALFAAVSALLLLHGAGTFRTPAPGSGGAVVAELIPLSALHRMLLRAAGAGAGGAGGTGTGAGGLGAAGVVELAALGAGVVLALTLSHLAARILVERIAASGRSFNAGT